MRGREIGGGEKRGLHGQNFNTETYHWAWTPSLATSLSHTHTHTRYKQTISSMASLAMTTHKGVMGNAFTKTAVTPGDLSDKLIAV